jgi:two-component system sensor histidine kinase AgrC
MLYQKKDLALQKSISFNVNIANTLTAYKIPRSELTNILINLIDNAFEAVENLDIEDRIVVLNFFTNNIEIANRVSLSFVKIDANMTDLFFKQGYSTKGSNRGFGLSNVLSIVEKYGLNISSKLANGIFLQRIEFSDKE